MSHYQTYKNRSNHDHYSDDCRCKRAKSSSKIMGVCSGISHQFGWDVTGVRVVAVLGLFFMTGPTFLAYIIAGALFY